MPSSAVYSFADYEKQILDFADEPFNTMLDAWGQPYAFNPLTYTHCDVNGDGDLTAGYAQTILQYYTANEVAGDPTTWEEILGEPDKDTR